MDEDVDRRRGSGDDHPGQRRRAHRARRETALGQLDRGWTDVGPRANPCYYVVGVYEYYDATGGVQCSETAPTNYWAGAYPEMDVQGYGHSIPDRDDGHSTTDGPDFEEVAVGGATAVHTFDDADENPYDFAIEGVGE